MSNQKEHIVICGDIKLGKKYSSKEKYIVHRFECNPESRHRNVNIDLPHFVKVVGCHFPIRIKDLLEIASYVYASDRMIDRGAPNSMEYMRWSRKFHYHIKVRDFKFWNKKEVKDSLNEALKFVSGDYSYEFTFHAGGKDFGQTSLTDMEGFDFEKKQNSHICLFSGGLDSLAGSLKLLSENKNLILISHSSNNLGVSATQNAILKRIMSDYPDRVQPFKFSCHLKGERAVEETQRSRIFLYTSIAFSLMSLASENSINVFENGITSINFAKRQDAMNARASRTTHPKTLHLIQSFLSLVGDKQVNVNHPFLFKTKSDILDIIKENKKEEYINSTLTCTKTFLKFQNKSNASHCGRCSQCVDRRFAAYATGLEEYDAVYDMDISKDSIDDQEGFIHLHDYLYKVFELKTATESSFSYDFYDELTDLIPYLQGKDNTEKMKSVYALVKNHTGRIDIAIQQIRKGEDLSKQKTPNSIFNILDTRSYLLPPSEFLVDDLCSELSKSIPIAFQTQKPANEKVLNDHIEALIRKNRDGYAREFPVIQYGTAKTVPDHSFDPSLFIESKYPRNKKSQSQLTDELAADIIKYGTAFKFFFIYDPERKITQDELFKKTIEAHPKCKVHIVR
ncbi:MAG: 7-cyano-7-deazaguanine synthase [Bacteroidia bacterium]|nr:7-cyano-7-deazaguanine synthase [Bacteroidia bacterium]